MFVVPLAWPAAPGPDRCTAIRGVILRLLAPGIVLWFGLAGFGRLLTGLPQMMGTRSGESGR
jgi:hypothetical protein